MPDNFNDIPFLSKLSHELKTPIHGISSLARYLTENWEKADDETKKEFLESILEASHGLEDLVSSALKYGEVSNDIKFNFSKNDIIAVTKKSVSKCKKLNIHKPINIHFNANVTSADSNLDPIWYGQLVSNLVLNAINYSEEDTTVDVSLVVDQKNKSWSVAVKDQGIGIKESEIDTIFSPFKRGSNVVSSTSGSGLGLAIAQEIVNAHGGSIEALNNKDKGATIKFTIPIK